MKQIRRFRLATAAGVLAASLITTGGTLLVTSSAASANDVTAVPVTVSCASLTGQVASDLSSASGTLNQCQVVPIPLFFNGAVSISPIDVTGATASPGTIVWFQSPLVTLSSTISVTAQAFMGDCSAVNPAAIPATLSLSITGGIGAGLSGSGVICVNPTDLSFVSNGAVVISGTIPIPHFD